MTNRRTVLCGIALGAFSARLSAQGAAPGKIARIGLLGMNLPAATDPLSSALIQGLREHGYVEGRNLVIDRPDAGGREDRLPELAADLVRRRADVIVIIGPAPLAAARKATNTIPLAKAPGLTIPASLLLRADKVIR